MVNLMGCPEPASPAQRRRGRPGGRSGPPDPRVVCWPCTQGPTAHVGQAHSRSALIRASSRCRSATSAASWSIRFDTASRREECAARTSPGAVVVNDPEGTPRYPPNASAKQHNQRVISSRPQPPSGLHIRARTSHGSLNQPRLARNHGLIVTMFTPLCRSHVKTGW